MTFEEWSAQKETLPATLQDAWEAGRREGLRDAADAAAKRIADAGICGKHVALAVSDIRALAASEESE